MISDIFKMTFPGVYIRHLDIGTMDATQSINVKADLHLYNEIAKSVVQRCPTPCFYGDALVLDRYLPPHSFDIITAFDVIEHLTKEDGFNLIRILERLSWGGLDMMIPHGRIIFFTPLGEYMLNNGDEKYLGHLSGWYPEDFIPFGYSCWVFPEFHRSLGVGAFFAIKASPLYELHYPDNDQYKNYWMA